MDESSRPLSLSTADVGGDFGSTIKLIELEYAELYYGVRCLRMDLSKYSIEELEQLLKELPEEISRRESEDGEAVLRKRKLFLEFQELAAKQGIDLGQL